MYCKYCYVLLSQSFPAYDSSLRKKPLKFKQKISIVVIIKDKIKS